MTETWQRARGGEKCFLSFAQLFTLLFATCECVLRQTRLISEAQAGRPPSHINSGQSCFLACRSSPRHQPLYFFIYLTALLKSLISLGGNSFSPSFYLSNFFSLAFNLALCQSSRVSRLSILYCYFVTYFWGHCDSHDIINFHHLPLSASLICCVALRVSYFVYASLHTPHCHLSCWVSIDIPN